MRHTRPLVLVAIACLALFVSACQKKNPDTSKVIATVNGEAITQADFDNYLQARQVQQPISDQDKKQALNEMVNLSLLAQDALNHKLDQKPDVYFLIKRQRDNILARAMIREYLKDHPISDDEVKKRYDEELAKTDKNEYRARHILVKTEAEALDIITQLQHGANFATLAKQKSIDTQSGKAGGELGWFNQSSMIPDFFNAVAKMKKGEISKQPVQTEYGYHVIQLEDRRPFKFPPFDDVKARIRQLVQQEKIDQMVKELKGKAKINISD